MKGHYLHTQILAHAVEAALERKGHEPLRELPVRSGQRPSSVDIAIRTGGQLHLFEIEQTPDRVDNDVAKAVELDAETLTVVVPNARVRARVQAALERLGHTACERPRIQVVTLGATLHWIHNL